MGWASATEYVECVWAAVREFIPEERRVEIVKKVMRPFLMDDWDTEEEFAAEYPEAAQALREMYPGRYDD